MVGRRYLAISTFAALGALAIATSASAHGLPSSQRAPVRTRASRQLTTPAGLHPAKRADFNGDGFTDLAAGAPDNGTGSERGAVVVAYGGPTGIIPAGTATWTLDSPGVPGTAADNDGFGDGLASADLDRDGFADLIVGVPGRLVDGETFAGEVVILKGSAAGLTATGVQVLTEDSPHVPGAPQAGEFFGETLATGDFDADGWPDLVIGAPQRVVSGFPGAGAIDVLYGGPGGVGSRGSRMFTRNTPGIDGNPFQYASFGISLASGDLGKGSQADLAVGAYGDPRASSSFTGSVTVLYGGSNGLSAAGSQRWAPGDWGRSPTQSNFATFGWSIAVGDVGKSKQADLVVGAINEQVSGLSAGAVYVAYGSPGGLTHDGLKRLTEATAGIPNDPASAQFGESLVIADFDGSGRGDLAVGARYRNDGTLNQAGGVYVIPGGAAGLAPAGTSYFGGIALSGQPATDQLWAGGSVTAGNFGRGKIADLAVGISGLTAGSTSDAGGVAILFGRVAGPDTSHVQLVDRDTISGFAPLATNTGRSLMLSPWHASD